MEETKIYDSLVTMRCLSWFFFNFTQEQIKELCEASKEFKYAWHEKLLPKVKKKKLFSIPDTMFYNLFTDSSFECQALIIAAAYKRYEAEAKNQINWNTEQYQILKAIANAEN
jgi:hypothetical protein